MSAVPHSPGAYVKKFSCAPVPRPFFSEMQPACQSVQPACLPSQPAASVHPARGESGNVSTKITPSGREGIREGGGGDDKRGVRGCAKVKGITESGCGGIERGGVEDGGGIGKGVRLENRCEQCDKAYASVSALKMHIRTHTLPCR